MVALVTRASLRLTFLAFVLALLAGSLALVGLRLVKVKMLPFDNKSEFQVIVDHPGGTPLEVTLETARRMRDYLASVPEVRKVEIYAGTQPRSTSTLSSTTTSCGSPRTWPTCR